MTGRFTRPLFWLALALPATLMLADLASGTVLAMDLLRPSGVLSVRLAIAAMLAGPLAGLFGPGRFLRGWLAVRRNLGVAAFGYAMLHLAFYGLDTGALGPILDELALAPIWTGWMALALMAVPAAISFDRAMVALGRHRWKSAQRLVYAALTLSIVHWLLLDWEWQVAVLHLLPLVLVWTALLIARFRNTSAERTFR